MSEMIFNRVIMEADYILKTEKTIREIAEVFNVSKSTVHKDLQERLPIINKNIYNKVDKILKHHIKIRHLRGGESTKKKYLKLRK
ncbi:MAG: sporulation transcriptional regulator SpoIIID [Bacilli bacterium]|nr:sporulation transcriptional regulator SpoIIID [Bacilli bacterium]MDD4547342.1 sporulation transcriptional regulator SpoIIID [Bacilli bacterium]